LTATIAKHQAAATAAPQGDDRLPGIDRLRGLVIVLMALDHVRDFFDADAIRFSPTDLSRTYPALFLTRFITHYCAPTFVLLAGVGAFLHGQRLQDPRKLSIFLLTRGLWLILLDAVVISPIWSLGSGKIELGTLWAIGAGMVALAALSRLPTRAVLVIGAVIVVAHNLLDRFHAADLGGWGPWWSLLHEPGSLPFGLPGGVIYPALPWIGVICIGYGLGPLFLAPAARRDRLLSLIGLTAIALFFALRYANIYGDPSPWTPQTDCVMTALSFLNVTKYPPSLLYALVTLGPAIFLLPRMERLSNAVGDFLAVFGRTPFFFYVLHLYVALGAAFALALARGFDLGQMTEFAASRSPPENFGVGLGGAYVAWIVLIAALYPLCRWFAGVKRRRRDWWLSYL
jgi:uncharacterized membrane protein